MRLSVDQFWAQYPFQPYELIAGEPIKQDSLGFRYSVVGLRVEARLTDFVQRFDLGEVLGANNGYRLSEHTLRAPRVSFVSHDKWQTIRYPYSYLPFAPDIAIEVFGTDFTEQTIRTICAQYVRAGTSYVWVFLPDLQMMTVYSRYENPRTFQRSEYLRLPKWHPEFAIPLADLLPKPRSFK